MGNSWAIFRQTVLVQTLSWLMMGSMNQPPPHLPSLFRGRHFDPAIITLCVRWYIAYKLSYRDLVMMMAARGAAVSYITVMRWVQRFVPEFEKRWDRYGRQVGSS